MWRLLSALPIGVVLADLVYGFVLNVLQGLDLQRAVPDSEGVLAVTPDCVQQFADCCKRRYVGGGRLRVGGFVFAQPFGVAAAGFGNRNIPDVGFGGGFGVQRAFGVGVGKRVVVADAWC